MLKYEKKAFWKFFSIYFGSVAILILVSGLFYFEDQKKGLIEKEHFSMIEYVRFLKSGKSVSSWVDIRHKYVDTKFPNFSMQNFKVEDDSFIKFVPDHWDGGFVKIIKDQTSFNDSIYELVIKILLYQMLLIAIFGSLSYFLSIEALKPMQEAIRKLDNFSKDLIHDLNTPITSILLNMKILEKKIECSDNKALFRIKRSVEDISELHNNLTILLEEETMIIQTHNISEIVEEVVLIHRKIFKDIDFSIDVNRFSKKVNKFAFKQIVSNLISNACKYNKEDAFVKIYSKNDTLYIEDGGIGIKNLDKVFNRLYHEHKSGHGIGLDIVQRLCDSMNIKISIESKIDVGTTVALEFKH